MTIVNEFAVGASGPADFTKSEALELILKNLREKSPSLADRAQLALDEGTESQELQELTKIKARKSITYTDQYRRRRPFTDEEAITVVLNVLRAHLVTHRLIANSATASIRQTQIGTEVSTDDKTAIRVAEGPLDSCRLIKVEIEKSPEMSRRFPEPELQLSELTGADSAQIGETGDMISRIQLLALSGS